MRQENLKKEYCTVCCDVMRNINTSGAGLVFRCFGGLGVACWPLVPKFAGSNPAEAFVFLTLNLPTTTIFAQPFNVIKWQLKFNPVA